ncbi:wax ester/triacylglycerol synthase domain-containing protein [Nocardia sp. NPDC024068]|uniref:wax ester/triacylglycerol synthase domain-containing protein n=1 Tax=Nocardia sp. NPDC024068 TaxID=3157197 RepID=UPI0033D6658F
MIPLAPPDATMYWLSRRLPNDQFLLYCFAESTRTGAELRADLAKRHGSIPELGVRLREDPTGLAMPAWVPTEPDPSQFIEHTLERPTWPALLAALGDVVGTGVDATRQPWRLHVFRRIRDSPAPDDAVTVVVLQISHALVDGRGASDIARALFAAHPDPGDAADRPAPEPEPSIGAGVRRSLAAAVTLPAAVVRTVGRGVRAGRAGSELAELTAAGAVPPPPPGYPPGPLNAPAMVGGHAVRLLVCPAEKFRTPGASVTVVGLTAISMALQRYLRGRGAEVTRLAAQVPMAMPRRPGVRNNYRGLGVDLAAGEPDPSRRAAAIAAELANRRRRAAHPLLNVQDAVTEVVPPILLRRDVGRYPIDLVPAEITGHTVVSSVNRGPADLTFGGAPVRFTGGFPALGSVMHLTHGIHGLGPTVTLSLHADPQTVPDLDHYAELLREACAEVSARLR